MSSKQEVGVLLCCCLSFLILSFKSVCFASLFFFFALANEIMYPLIYAFAQSHNVRGDISGETFVSK